MPINNNANPEDKTGTSQEISDKINSGTSHASESESPVNKAFAEESEIYTVTIEDLTTEGQGIARIPAEAYGGAQSAGGAEAVAGGQPVAGTESVAGAQASAGAQTSAGETGANTRGYTVFCEGLLPGEEAQIRITSRKKSYALAECVNLITPSPDRVTPYCPVYDTCGGCTLQHLNYQKQLHLKREHVVSCLTRIGKQPADTIETLTRPTIGMDHPYDYRNHMQYPVGETVTAESTAAGAARDFKIGLYGKKSHIIVPHNACRLAHPACESVRRMTERFCLEKGILGYDEQSGLGFLRHLIVRIGPHTGEVMIILVVNSVPGKPFDFPVKEYVSDISFRLEKDRKKIARANQDADITTAPEKPWKLKSLWVNFNPTGVRQGQVVSPRQENQRLLFGAQHITDRIGANKFMISPLSFFQINSLQTEKLYDTVRDFAIGNMTPADVAAMPETPQITITSILDLYCGAGTIGLHLARYTGQLVGVESNEGAIADARRNAAQNGATNATFIAAKVEEVPRSEIPYHPTLVILDPPRKGSEPVMLAKILILNPEKIIYVSCDAATLARDLAILTAGEYKIKAIQPVDMFPWTGHVETVVLMSREEVTKA